MITTNRTYNKLRKLIWRISNKIPFLSRFIKKSERAIKGSLTPGSLFEDLGLRYIGPVDGHSLKDLIRTFDLRSNGWTIDAEIMLQSFKRNAKIMEIPTQFLGQPGGRKSFVGYKAIFEFLLFLFKQRLFGIK